MKYLLLIILLSFLSCEKDPYPGEGGFLKNPREPNRNVKPPRGIAVDQKYTFEEGKKKTVTIGVYVKPPGKPDLVVKNLPEGVVFDPKTFTLTWKPGPFQGNDLSDPTKKTRVYNIELILRDANDLQGDTLTENVTLVVNDVPRDFDVEARDEVWVDEGRTLTYDFEVRNIDYPAGPFAVNSAEMPANAKVTQVSDTMFRLSYEPDHHHVKINERNSARYVGKISVYNPANHRTEKTVKINVRDRRLGLKLVTPPEMEQGLDSTFQVSAYDLNAEVAPKIELVGSEPEYGEFETTIVRDENNNSSVLNVVWKDIPPSYNGQSKTFRFRACVLSRRNQYSNCETANTVLKIRVKDRRAPNFNRVAWDVGELKYFEHGDTKRFRISARDGDNGRSLDNLEVKPDSMKQYVSWNRGILTVKGTKTDIHQFSLVAKSEYNMSTAESFVFEVFKKERSKILYFTDSTRDAEVSFFKENLKNIELMNPAIQVLNDRNLAGRHTLVLGTSVLFDTQMQQQVEQAISRIPSIIVASPMIENLPKSFLDMIRDELNISIQGRFSELPTEVKLTDHFFVQRPDFASSTNKVRVKGTASVESADPVFFYDGVLADKCSEVLELNESTSQEAKQNTIGVICRLPSRGRLALLGTEFADIFGEGVDKDIAAKWFNNMLNSRIGN